MKKILLIAVVLFSGCVTQKQYATQGKQIEFLEYKVYLQQQLVGGKLTTEEYADLVAGYCQIHNIKDK